MRSFCWEIMTRPQEIMFCGGCSTGRVVSSVMASNNHHCHDQLGMMIGWNKSLNLLVANYVRV